MTIDQQEVLQNYKRNNLLNEFSNIANKYLPDFTSTKIITGRYVALNCHIRIDD